MFVINDILCEWLFRYSITQLQYNIISNNFTKMEKQTPNSDEAKDVTNVETLKKSTKNGLKSKIRGLKTPNALVTVVAVLVIMAGIQVFQTQQLLAAVASGSINTGTQQNGGFALPSQVGGCG